MARRDNGEGTIYQRSDGRWAAMVYVTMTDGTRRRVGITKRSRDEVKLKLKELLDQENRHIPFTEKKWTVAEYLDYWMNEVQIHRIRETTFLGYSRMIRDYTKPLLGHKRLIELGVRDVQIALDKLRDMGKSGRLGQEFVQVLSSCLGRAMREEIIFRNVAQLVEKPKHTPKETKVWTVEQARHFLDANKDHRLYVHFLLLITYGMRRSEALGLRWSDIDFENDRFVLRQQIDRINGVMKARTLKTANSSRTLPLTPDVRQALLKQAENQGVTLPAFDPDRELCLEGTVNVSKVGKVSEPRVINHVFASMTKNAGLPRIKLHALRHTAATILKDIGTPMKDIQLILGHSNISTTMNIYTHGNEETRREALNSLGGVLSGETSDNDATQNDQEFTGLILPAPVAVAVKTAVKPQKTA